MLRVISRILSSVENSGDEAGVQGSCFEPRQPLGCACVEMLCLRSNPERASVCSMTAQRQMRTSVVHSICKRESSWPPTLGLSAQVEKLLEEVDASADSVSGAAPPSPEALDSRVRLYERVASEVSRLNFHAAKGAPLPLVQQLTPRIQAATAKLKVICCCVAAA